MRTLAIVVVGLLIAAVVVRDASRVHLDNCRQAAFTQVGEGPLPPPKSPDSMDSPYMQRAGELLKGCSRWPW